MLGPTFLNKKTCNPSLNDKSMNATTITVNSLKTKKCFGESHNETRELLFYATISVEIKFSAH
jgi:hypothetical protein